MIQRMGNLSFMRKMDRPTQIEMYSYMQNILRIINSIKPRKRWLLVRRTVSIKVLVFLSLFYFKQKNLLGNPHRLNFSCKNFLKHDMTISVCIHDFPCVFYSIECNLLFQTPNIFTCSVTKADFTCTLVSECTFLAKNFCFK